ncbi:hypothetical protein CgunFtcFv8_014130 [Champsocephalus gunnari]|uniref:Uncharacterized protein n=1 Tax=Champsocephalus gunnari TaxID=52237 RepID=A0AAN8HZN2_CHAGU|nr:hypothetical protein CgunFtcFv8_014130 [Champsocephalus gunnari]
MASPGLPLPESDARTGSDEPRGRSTVQRYTTLCRLDSTSKDCEPAVGALRQSRGGSVRIERQRSVSAVLCDASKCTVRRGYTRARLAPGLLYAFPPLALIPPTLARVREQRHTLILIAPH